MSFIVGFWVDEIGSMDGSIVHSNAGWLLQEIDFMLGDDIGGGEGHSVANAEQTPGAIVGGCIARVSRGATSVVRVSLFGSVNRDFQESCTLGHSEIIWLSR